MQRHHLLPCALLLDVVVLERIFSLRVIGKEQRGGDGSGPRRLARLGGLDRGGDERAHALLQVEVVRQRRLDAAKLRAEHALEVEVGAEELLTRVGLGERLVGGAGACIVRVRVNLVCEQ